MNARLGAEIVKTIGKTPRREQMNSVALIPARAVEWSVCVACRRSTWTMTRREDFVHCSLIKVRQASLFNIRVILLPKCPVTQIFVTQLASPVPPKSVAIRLCEGRLPVRKSFY
ncbi:hypothetical protein L596_001510 [Steinernema carpocapsae]|uniref:Uncharacterized protein n=1 Tax=Steinernema carpocapsae TaxID=34508 RepID=A0A4U8UQF8_STECR|nr:hypothetical protein L596_001510 [Steinernema carpocapsae]